MGKKSRKQTNRNRKNQQRKQQYQQTKMDNNQSIELVEMKMKESNVNSVPDIIDVQLSLQPSGLPNMGNTCYFNSVMQVLGQTYLLHHLLTERCSEDYIWNARTFYLKETNGKSIFASENLHLKMSEANLLEKYFLELQANIFQNKLTNPRGLLGEIRREKHQFAGMAQQDSQELLIGLLELLKKVESNRQIKALIQGLNIENPKNANDDDKCKANRYRITAKHTVIDAIFGGQLLSIIYCTVCHYRSFTFEPFIDLSLPLDCHTDTKANLTTLLSATKNRKNVSDDEEEENDDGEIESRQTNEPSNVKHLTPKERKLKRQQKKAARREARQKLRDQLSSDKGDDDEEKNDSDNSDLEEAVEATEIDHLSEIVDDSVHVNGDLTNDVSGESDNSDNVKENNLKTEINPVAENGNVDTSDQDKEEIENLSDSEPSESISCLSEIREEFRNKFYSYVHQRMSHTDDDYDNRSLGKLLKSFIKEEILDGPNKYLCENCSKLNDSKKIYSKAIRCQLIALPPPVLVLHLKRFEASGRRMMLHTSMHKLNTSITFPEHLYLSPYTSRIYEHFSRFYEPEVDPSSITSSNEHRLEYRLYGVVIHSGSLRCGHYMAYVCVRPSMFQMEPIRKFLHLKPFVSNIEHILSVCYEDFGKTKLTAETDSESIEEESKADDNRRWYFVSDSSVSPVTLDSVLRDTSSPYLLFYERTC